MTVPEHIRISVEAVGGIETEEGQEMMRRLIEREQKPQAAIEEKPAALPPPVEEESVIGQEIETLLARAKEVKEEGV